MSEKKKTYLEAFQHLAETRPDLYQFPGDHVLVEVLEDSSFEKTIKTDDGRSISLTLATGAQKQINGITVDRPTFARILLVGEGTVNETTGDLEPFDVSPGDIVLLPGTSIKRFSVYGKLVNYGERVIGLALASDIQKRWKGESAFDEYFSLLNTYLAS